MIHLSVLWQRRDGRLVVRQGGSRVMPVNPTISLVSRLFGWRIRLARRWIGNLLIEKIKNRSKYIRRFSEPRGWGKHRFFGFDRAQVASIRSLYRQSNNEFAKAVWGVRDWNEAFAGLRFYPQNVLREDKLSAEELFELDELVS